MPVTMSQPFRSFSRVASLAVLAILLPACSEQGGAPASPGGPPPLVTVTDVRAEPWQDTLEAVGTARSSESIVISSKISERVQSIAFESGQAVRAGDVLVRLDTGGDTADLEAARTAYREAQRQYQRQQELAGDRLVPVSSVDAQRAARDAAQARLQQASARVADRVIVAPFDGVLGLREVSPGQLLSPGTPITTLDATAVMQVDFAVPEVWLSQVRSGLVVEATTDAWPAERFRGEIASVDSRIDVATRSVMVRATVANPDGRLLPGMLMAVAVLRPAREALVLPEIAVQQNGADSFVYRVGTDGTAERVVVRVGSRAPGRVEVREGLSAGDRVVVDGAVKLRPGQPLQVAVTEPDSAQD